MTLTQPPYSRELLVQSEDNSNSWRTFWTDAAVTFIPVHLDRNSIALPDAGLEGIRVWKVMFASCLDKCLCRETKRFASVAFISFPAMILH